MPLVLTPQRHTANSDAACLSAPLSIAVQSPQAMQHPEPTLQGGWLECALRRQLLGKLSNLRGGELILQEAGRGYTFGAAATDGLKASVRVNDPAFYRQLALGGSIGAAEAYIHGDWYSDDLTAVVRLMARNAVTTGRLEGMANWLTQPLWRVLHWFRRNNATNSRRNIAAHYDLGNDFFAAFLDESLAYSSGIYETSDSTLAQAQLAKCDRICQKLNLQPSDHLLEIGCGWGGLAIHAARKFGCRVTGTTISQRQFELVRQRVAEAGLEQHVRIVLEDYRQLLGKYDKLVSVEMIEAVGPQYFDTYFGTCARLLVPGGQMVLQAITIADRLYPDYRRNVDFIQKYIFPGGHLPCLSAITSSLARVTDFTVAHLENLPQHYARTLADWRANFLAHQDELKALGLSDEFLRMWEFYFCYCEGGFREEHIGLVQMLLTKPPAR